MTETPTIDLLDLTLEEADALEIATRCPSYEVVDGIFAKTTPSPSTVLNLSPSGRRPTSVTGEA